MHELKKMLREPIASGVEHLTPESLAMILGVNLPLRVLVAALVGKQDHAVAVMQLRDAIVIRPSSSK